MNSGFFIKGTLVSSSQHDDQTILCVKGSGDALYQVVVPPTLPVQLPEAGGRIEVSGTASYVDGQTVIWANRVCKDVPVQTRKRPSSAFLRG